MRASTPFFQVRGRDDVVPLGMEQSAMIICVVALLVGLPLLGVAMAGQPLERYLEFPPLTRYVDHAPFSWAAFIGLAVLVGAITAPFLIRVTQVKHRSGVAINSTEPFPWWGWTGVGVVAAAWMLAWTRFPWFADLQPFTFTPLWIGYILIANALTVGRTGSCLMWNRPRYFLGLFPLSAALWWFFEYLNRFVQNWYYAGISEFTAWEYFLHATLPFSTVLPAVLSTTEWLASFPRLNEAWRNAWPIRIRNPKALGWLGFLLATAGLMGIGIWPDYLFPLLWLSPLIVVTSLQALLGKPTVFSSVKEGDWRPIWLPALAGLVCGFFWEMWNVNSLAHWEYVVPYVHRAQIFEMPLLGYAGYLPFGVECKVIAELFFQKTS